MANKKNVVFTQDFAESIPGRYHNLAMEYLSRGQRTGQARMNALALTDPELHEQLTNTEADPYFDDKNLPAYEAALKAAWHGG